MSNGVQGGKGPICVEVADEPYESGRPWTDPKTGVVKMLPGKQTAYLHQGDRYPLKFKVALPESGPYRPGMYLLAGGVFKPGEYDGLKFFDRTLELVSVADAMKQLAPGAGPKLAAAS